MPALIFDCDGVLADTERYGHLPAFNRTFADFGLPVHWSEADYAGLLRIGGGKERMASLLTADFVVANKLPAAPEAQKELLAAWHKSKSQHYAAAVEDGQMPARPGIVRIVDEARSAGWQLAVASTSAESSVRAVLEHVVGEERAAGFRIYAGDVVARKKPAPDIYELAIADLGITAKDAVVVEDSENGLRAALAAGLKTLVTVSSYTAEENFEGAALVVSSLGEIDEPADILSDPLTLCPRGEVTLATLTAILKSPEAKAP
ncbi:HAD superfamily hydrolase (TIGR01509 family) [Arthrobacter sp. V4I6]|uniref:HAD-IA family hydrolase n=1 Tax=unclassified Arthrobacter TaxID=235627 RepID=UPI0027812B12|nr:MULTISPECIES: HAD-IA family hydrolase [unclassified Arthrobacter]MDQ0821408.1 HAD superfamily hydrolase (TIGR01509 family) [Arthrobacter sp. V1I7]MDQ0855673.1 HAD superfamily hydrolase (TIGR01509 family) [Arthrobacter sp. V4I6]